MHAARRAPRYRPRLAATCMPNSCNTRRLRAAGGDQPPTHQTQLRAHLPLWLPVLPATALRPLRNAWPLFAAGCSSARRPRLLPRHAAQPTPAPTVVQLPALRKFEGADPRLGSRSLRSSPTPRTWSAAATPRVTPALRLPRMKFVGVTSRLGPRTVPATVASSWRNYAAHQTRAAATPPRSPTAAVAPTRRRARRPDTATARALLPHAPRPLLGPTLGCKRTWRGLRCSAAWR